MLFYINKNELLDDIAESIINNKHITSEGRAVHRQEHTHLLNIVNRQPAYKLYTKDDVINILEKVFSELESMMEINEYSDPEFGKWTETVAEVMMEDLVEMKNKYVEIVKND